MSLPPWEVMLRGQSGGIVGVPTPSLLESWLDRGKSSWVVGYQLDAGVWGTGDELQGQPAGRCGVVSLVGPNCSVCGNRGESSSTRPEVLCLDHAIERAAR